MEPSLKRRRDFPSDDDEGGGGDGASRRAAQQRKVRFPKGKKNKGATVVAYKVDGEEDEGDAPPIKPGKAAELRAKRRKREPHIELADEGGDDISRAEVGYAEDHDFVEDGIAIEPFNLNKEREEGYFDESGNFVEYARPNEIKDAWLDSVQVDSKLAARLKDKGKGKGKGKGKDVEEEEFQDLTSDDIGKIKRIIADILLPGETIIQALKRLKGTTDNKTKMSEQTKRVFDQLTETAMKLMENGEYNVYHEEKETFQREAEGYERLARARGGSSGSILEEDIFAEDDDNEKNGSSIWDVGSGPSASNASAVPQSATNDDDGELDMFGDDDENTDRSKAQTENAEGSKDSDYVYDPSSGYYYSSSLGYYFDAASGLYCNASTGTWYSFDEQTGTYNEVESSTAPAGES